MPSLRLIAWNCNHGSLSTRLSELAECSPDIVFLQECAPTETLPLTGQFFTRRLNGAKGIALGSLNPNYHLTDLTPRPTSGAAVLGATVTGPVSFTVLGVWGQKPYADDVMRTLNAYDDLLRSGSSVVMGDLNSGTPPWAQSPSSPRPQAHSLQVRRPRVRQRLSRVSRDRARTGAARDLSTPTDGLRTLAHRLLLRPGDLGRQPGACSADGWRQVDGATRPPSAQGRS
jgi:endonuclease/exonuclease/phosphatase family metal-dependent hydrolase